MRASLSAATRRVLASLGRLRWSCATAGNMLTFFYFDQDGSTYLSEQEFAMARDSAMTPS